MISWYGQLRIRKTKCKKANAFVVYRFNAGEKVCLDNAETIRTVTYSKEYALPKEKGKFVYVVTVLDRANNESAKGTTINVKM